MAAPTLTAEERMAALEKAKAARQKRAQISQKLKKGELSLEEVLDMRNDEIIGRMKVTTLLESISGIGPATAEKIMSQIKIAPCRRLGGLGDRQREELLALFQEEK